MNPESDLEYLKAIYSSARNKYKPRFIRVLLIAEAPPNNLDRYFYFEDVKKQDSLFIEVMGVLYPEQKARYLQSGRETALKKELLERFRDDGFWLMDVSEVPLGISNATLEGCAPYLIHRLEKHIDKKTPIVLIKANIYDLCYPVLLSYGYNVQAVRMPFPGSGQQKVFREKFRKVMSACC